MGIGAQRGERLGNVPARREKEAVQTGGGKRPEGTGAKPPRRRNGGTHPRGSLLDENLTRRVEQPLAGPRSGVGDPPSNGQEKPHGEGEETETPAAENPPHVPAEASDKDLQGGCTHNFLLAFNAPLRYAVGPCATLMEMTPHAKRNASLFLRAAFGLVLIFLGAPSAAAEPFFFPEPDPPVVTAPPDARLGSDGPQAALSGAPEVEWTYHKTPDGLHPDGNEQQLLWLANRARANPAQEGIWLAELSAVDADVGQAVRYFGVNLAALQEAFAALPAKPPAAFDARLYAAARAHSEYLIGIDGQTHDGQFLRIQAAGFKYTAAAGIVFSYSKSALFGHAAFNIDWGIGPDGMQDPPGHRLAIMGISGNWTNAGYAVVPETHPATSVGPQVITGNFATANTAYADHHNRFLVGTVWEDTNANGRYDPGEGLAGVRVLPDRGTYFAVTGSSGGYAVPILEPGLYRVSFSSGELDRRVECTVSMGGASVLLDFESYAGCSTSSSSVAVGGGSGGGGGGGGCFLGAASSGGPPATTGLAVLALLGLVSFGARRLQPPAGAAGASSPRTSSSRSM